MVSANVLIKPFRMSSNQLLSSKKSTNPLINFSKTLLSRLKKNRLNNGKYCLGKTPYQTLLDLIHLANEKQRFQFYIPIISNQFFHLNTYPKKLFGGFGEKI